MCTYYYVCIIIVVKTCIRFKIFFPAMKINAKKHLFLRQKLCLSNKNIFKVNWGNSDVG